MVTFSSGTFIHHFIIIIIIVIIILMGYSSIGWQQVGIRMMGQRTMTGRETLVFPWQVSYWRRRVRLSVFISRVCLTEESWIGYILLGHYTK